MAWAQSQKELDDLKRLAQQRKEEAEARKQLNDAENSIAVATDQNNVRADKLQLQRQAEHERSMAARQRFADSHAMTAVRDPGRFAPQAVKAARDYLENRGFGNRRYEFDQAQQTARHEASEKARLKEVWDAFKGAFGIADLTAEQVENMTLDQFVDAVNAELMRGSEFGTRKAPPGRASVKAYDEQSADSNGLYRWAHERGCLFQLPIDRERTHPGGRVYLSTDDANITDWIESALHGVELRMSESGKIYAKGQNGLTGDLAVIFGRYPQAGENDGIYGQIADDTGHREHASLGDPQSLVDALLKDRDNYQAWKKSGGVDAETRAAEEREEFERRQAEGEARQRWEDSGLGVVEYVKSRIEEGDPAFDLDWETARELANAEAQAIEEVVPYEGDVPFSVRRGEGAGAAARAAATGQDTGIKMSVARVNPNLASDIREAISGDAKGNPVGRRKEVSFSDMPETLKAVGIPDLPIRTRTDIVRKLKRGHGFSEEQIAALPTAYGQPVAVFSDGKAFVILTEMQIATRKGIEKPVMVVFRESVDRNGRHEFLASAYPREAANENFYEGLAKNGRMLFLDKNKVAVIGLSGRTISTLNKQADGNRVKTPEDLSSLVSDDIIANPAAGAQGGSAKFSVGNLYTGSAADYDKPSLHAVGTGEGSQVYGWGLYASSVRGVAEGYAHKGNVETKVNGKSVDLDSISARETPSGVIADTAWGLSSKGYTASRDALIRTIRAVLNSLDQRAQGKSQRDGAHLAELASRYRDALRILEDKSNTIEVLQKGNLYEQTFFTDRAPGDKSHLLNWYEMDNLKPGNHLHEQVKWIRRQAKSEGVRLPKDLGGHGSDVYESIVNALGSQKAASEFLSRAGIDGVKYPVDSYGGPVKDGDKVGWNYVSFRDDNIRVDHKWTDGVARFGASPDGKILDEGLFAFDPNTEAAFAMGETEQRPSGIAAGIERAEALRPWTAKESPAAKAGPIAFDAADLVALWRAVSGSTRNPHVQKGERIKGRKNVVNGWKQYHADPKAKQYKQMRAIKDPKLKAKAMEWIDGGAKWQD